MRNLLEMETGFLSQPTVQDALQLVKVKNLQKWLKHFERTRFRKQLELAALMAQGKEWFDSENTKALFLENGLSWTTEDLADKVFECGKSWMFKMIKASQVSEEKVNEFESQCKELQDAGEKVKISIEELNRFASGVSTVEQLQCDRQDSEDTAEDSVLEDTPSTDTHSEILTFAWKTPNGNTVSGRVTPTEGLVSTNTVDEILMMMDFLQGQLNTASLAV